MLVLIDSWTQVDGICVRFTVFQILNTFSDTQRTFVHLGLCLQLMQQACAVTQWMKAEKDTVQPGPGSPQ
ncbi:hypothetical protein Q5P01_005619 [Channa striata]|uniref:Uncharacterized protein n=1 Tax=Channa striata TaxID=64152 RepID=A0AA88SZN9_CHASR|nr:hypothetical protein Q5P01_005619 [Channa striata]